MHLRDDDENYVLLWFVLYLLRIWGTARYGIFVFRVIHGKDVYNFDETDMVLMHLQSIGDSAQAFCNCLLFCVKDTTVRRGIWRNLCWRERDRQLRDYNQIHYGVNANCRKQFDVLVCSIIYHKTLPIIDNNQCNYKMNIFHQK